MRPEPVAVIVLAKLPLPGLAKTRLAPALGDAGAAQLAERLLRRAVQAAREAGLGPVELCLAPHTRHPLADELAAGGDLALTSQGDGDLGDRMHRALTRVLAAHPAALLMGADIPALDAAYLRAAADALAGADAVFGPALDGGYVLVGLRRPQPALFERMRWSQPRVMQDTRDRLASLGLRHHELPPLADIDEPADLARLPPDWLPDPG